MIRNFILTTVFVLIFATNLFAQNSTTPDTVCAGSNTYYKIPNPTSGSTFTWGIYHSGGTIETTSQSDSIRITWQNTTGTDSLWVFETNNANCQGDTAKLVVVRIASPTAEFDNATLCYGETLNINFSGTAPFNIEYTLNGTTVTKNGITDNPYSIGETPGTYNLVQITDKYCNNNTFSGQSNAIIGEKLQQLQIIHD